jgi:hypothetical protein
VGTFPSIPVCFNPVTRIQPRCFSPITQRVWCWRTIIQPQCFPIEVNPRLPGLPPRQITVGAAQVGPTGWQGCGQQGGAGGGHTAATVCTQVGCPTYPSGDCTFFNCPSRICGGGGGGGGQTAATVCTQFGQQCLSAVDACPTRLCGGGEAVGGAQVGPTGWLGCTQPPQCLGPTGWQGCGQQGGAGGGHTASTICTQIGCPTYPSGDCTFFNCPSRICGGGGGGGGQTAATVCTQFGQQCLSAVDACPTRLCGGGEAVGGAQVGPTGWLGCTQPPQCLGPTGWQGCGQQGGAGGGHTASTICTQIGCPTYPSGDCTFFNCPTRICGGAEAVGGAQVGPTGWLGCTQPPNCIGQTGWQGCGQQQGVGSGQSVATICTQMGCPTYPSGDCTFFNCPTRICGGGGGGAEAVGGAQVGPTGWLGCTQMGCPTYPSGDCTFFGCPPGGGGGGGQTVATVCTQFGQQCLSAVDACPTRINCPTQPSGDCTFFNCPTGICAAGGGGGGAVGAAQGGGQTMATVCTQLGCPTYPSGDCTFFSCPSRICGGQTMATVCTQVGQQCLSAVNACPTRINCPTQPSGDCTFFNCPTGICAAGGGGGGAVGAAQGGGQTMATVCTQVGCPTYPSGDCTFFSCPSRICGGGGGGGGQTAATVCTQFGHQCQSAVDACPTRLCGGQAVGAAQGGGTIGPTGWLMCTQPPYCIGQTGWQGCGQQGGGQNAIGGNWPTPMTRCFVC